MRTFYRRRVARSRKRRQGEPIPYRWVALTLILVASVAYPGTSLRAFFTPTRVAAHVWWSLAGRRASLLHVVAPRPTQEQRIRGEIQTVFGPDAPKAFRLLACENPSLNPSAVQVNADGSRDVGLFQINNRWQGVSNEAFLRDYPINVRMAYSIYTRTGHSFRLWTCGRRLHL